MSNNDYNNCAYAYSVNMLKMLLKMRLITKEEFNKISKISATHYGCKNIFI